MLCNKDTRSLRPSKKSKTRAAHSHASSLLELNATIIKVATTMMRQMMTMITMAEDTTLLVKMILTRILKKMRSSETSKDDIRSLEMSGSSNQVRIPIEETVLMSHPASLRLSLLFLTQVAPQTVLPVVRSKKRLSLFRSILITLC
jgi:hypothetical protein